MATIQHYNHTASLLQPGGIDLTDTWTVVLLDSNAAFDATHTTLTAATNSGAWEVSGSGWTEGGEAISNVAGAIANTNEGEITADTLTVSITGGDLGPFDHYLICVGDVPLSCVTLSTSKTVLDGYNAQIPWLNGVLYSVEMV